MSEQLIRLPEFEQRAEGFIQGVKELIEEDEDVKWHVVSEGVKKALPGLIKGYDALQSIIEDSVSDSLPQPQDLADDLDARSVDSCVVEFYCIMDSKKPLERFIQKILLTANKFNGDVDTSMMFGTEDEVDFISPRYDEANGWLFHSIIYFDFR